MKIVSHQSIAINKGKNMVRKKKSELNHAKKDEKLF